MNLSFLNELLPLWAACEFPQGLAFLPTRNQTLPAHPKSVIVAAFPYLLPEELYAGRNIARYAVPRDYHQVAGERLGQACELLRTHFPDEEFVHFCDHSPLPEVALAEHAGLGFRGRHNLLITKKYGSWVVLGEIITSAALPKTTNQELRVANCDGCPAPCIKICPTGALGDDGFDKFKCLSYLSQRKDELTPEAAKHLHDMQSSWGCDLCQEVCLSNRNVTIDPLPEFLESANPVLSGETPIEDRAYHWRGRAVLGRNIKNLTGG